MVWGNFLAVPRQLNMYECVRPSVQDIVEIECCCWTAELTQAPGLQSSCPVIMEDSIDSMSDNGCDNDTPLKQVVELCSLLAGKGLQFSISVRIKNSLVFSREGVPHMLVGRKDGSF